LRETLFDLHVQQVQLLDGWILYNDVKTPLAVQGSRFRLAVDSGEASGTPIYLGSLEWREMQVAAMRYFPVSVTFRPSSRCGGRLHR